MAKRLVRHDEMLQGCSFGIARQSDGESSFDWAIKPHRRGFVCTAALDIDSGSSVQHTLVDRHFETFHKTMIAAVCSFREMFRKEGTTPQDIFEGIENSLLDADGGKLLEPKDRSQTLINLFKPTDKDASLNAYLDRLDRRKNLPLEPTNPAEMDF
jgi:hypothetical protein